MKLVPILFALLAAGCNPPTNPAPIMDCFVMVEDHTTVTDTNQTTYFKHDPVSVPCQARPRPR